MTTAVVTFGPHPVFAGTIAVSATAVSVMAISVEAIVVATVSGITDTCSYPRVARKDAGDGSLQGVDVK